MIITFWEECWNSHILSQFFCEWSGKVMSSAWSVFPIRQTLRVGIHNFIFGRMETLNLKRFHGIAKASGVLFSIAGVIVLAFYQGPAFRSFIHRNPFHHTSNFHAGVTAHPKRVWIFGIFLTTLSTTSWALWTVLQVRMCPGASFIYTFSDHSRCRSNVTLCLLKIFTYTVIVSQGPMLEAYPSKLLNTTLQMIFATIQCFFIALAAERDFSKW